MREHEAHLLLAVLDPLVPVVVDVGPERGRHRAGVADAGEQRGVDQRAVLEAMARIGARPHALHALVGVEHHVDGDVAVAMDADLKVVAVGVLHDLVDLLLGHREDAEVVRAPDVGRAHGHGAAGGGPVGVVLDAAHAHPLVAEPAMDAGRFQPGRHQTQAVHGDPAAQLARPVGILVGDGVVGAAAGIVERREAGRGGEFGDELHPRLALLAGGAGGEEPLEEVVGVLGQEPVQLAVVELDLAAGGRLGFGGDAGELEGAAVVPVEVAAPVGDSDRMVRDPAVQVAAGDAAPFAHLGVVVLEGEHPLARRLAGGALAQAFADLGHGAHVQVDLGELAHAARGGMEVGVDEARRDGHALRVDDLGAGTGEIPDVVARPDRDEARVLDREGLGLRQVVVHGVDASPDQDQVRGYVARLLKAGTGAGTREPRVRSAQLEVADAEAGGEGGADAEKLSPRVAVHGLLRAKSLIIC